MCRPDSYLPSPDVIPAKAGIHCDKRTAVSPPLMSFLRKQESIVTKQTGICRSSRGKPRFLSEPNQKT
ncbi:Uncharacterized protein dnm_068570 [Desulfonema magnum]|uniref:Uncharacterized protein n=1 Tax=Desulfonema magnum TaxID=45655 RepID=A0A975BSC7_9BACT|nr:Uncharacterized protein dnm_068570 [Desulfonema magnum]